MKNLKSFNNFINENIDDEVDFTGFDTLEELYEEGTELLDDAQKLLNDPDYLDSDEAIEKLTKLGTDEALLLASQIKKLNELISEKEKEDDDDFDDDDD
jgi:hypothetical protein